MFEQFGILPVPGGLYDQDMDFLTELRMARQARNDHSLLSAESKDNKELRAAQAKRRVELLRWRRGE
jgi:hypothetical protein